MTEINRVTGLNTPTDSAGKTKNKSATGAEEFKELMKVKKMDPDQKKRRKRKDESSEENAAEMGVARSILQTKISNERLSLDNVKFQNSSKALHLSKTDSQNIFLEDTSHDQEAYFLGVSQKLGESIEVEKEKESLKEEKIQSNTQSIETVRNHELQVEDIPPPAVDEEKDSKQATKTETQKSKVSQDSVIQPLLQTSSPFLLPPMPVAAPSYTSLSREILELFEYISCIMATTLAKDSGTKEITIHLSPEMFENSVFSGAQIVIKEFSTAPKVFNIELKGDVKSTALFEKNIKAMHAAFKNSEDKFQVNSLSTSLLAGEKEA